MYSSHKNIPTTYRLPAGLVKTNKIQNKQQKNPQKQKTTLLTALRQLAIFF